jgi:hypothetical protein
MRTRLTISALLIALSSCVVLSVPFIARAQDEGPMAPPPTIEVKRLPSVPHPGPPPIPEQEIVQRFAANEDAMKKAFDLYTYTQTVRYEEETDPVGMLTASGDTYFKDDGQRYWRITKKPQSTLHISPYTLDDILSMAGIPYFFLTTENASNYTFLYAGQQQLDQINTYVFQVKPKLLSRKQRFFDGVIWVDDHDFAIVRTWGKFVLQVEPEGDHLPFTMYETYRENFEDKYWLPTYTASDDEITATDGTKIPVRLIVRDTDFKRRSDSAPPPASPSSTADPVQTSPLPK